MRIATNTRNTLESEIEELSLEPCLLEEGHEEGAETAVYMQRDLALDGEFGERGYVVDDAVGEVGC